MGKKKGGKNPSGRAKQKQKAHKTTGSPWQAGKSRRGYSDDDEDDQFTMFRGFAQTKSHFASTPTKSSTELRHRAIAFVSAGVSTPPIEAKHQLGADSSEEMDEDEEEEDLDDSALQTNIVMDIDGPDEKKESIDALREVQQQMETIAMDAHDETIVHEEVETKSTLFVVDTIGDEKLIMPTKASSRPPARPASPTPSDSSEEKVVFHGRRQATVINDPIPATFAKSDVQALNLKARDIQAPTSQKISRVLKSADAWDLSNQINPLPSATAGIGRHPSKSAKPQQPEEPWSPAPEGSWWRKHGPGEPQLTLEQVKAGELSQLKNGHGESSTAGQKSTAEDKGAEDTIASLQAVWQDTLRQKKAAKKNGHATEKLGISSAKPSDRRGKKGRKRGNRALKAGMMSDDDGLSEGAYNDYMENLAAQMEQEDAEEEDASDTIVSGRKAFAGTSGLAGPAFVVDGQAYGEHEVLPPHLRVPKAKATAIEQDGETGDDSAWVSDDSKDGLSSSASEDSENDDDDDDQSELEGDIEYSEAQMYEDEDDLRKRRIERMEDEELARLFAKQEEFGIDNDELVIDADGDYLDGFGDVLGARAGLANISNFISPRSANKSKRRGKGEPQFRDATALAEALDQYGDNGFDIMDMDRPSLRPIKKGRKGKIPAELEAISDDDFRDSMLQTWENDRNKKRLKKLEREELRMDGLLGKAARTGKSDLAAKYSTGMTIKQAFDELHEFLLRTDLEQRAFPPMAKSDRKALHEICQKLNLNSKSQGAGRLRFPVITKTKRTPGPGDHEFDIFVSTARSGVLSNPGQIYKLRNSMARKGRDAANRAGRGPGGGHAGTMLKNGDIVGATAAKIGSESFGHRMMQKMGWQEGRGLGQAGEGLVNPVEQRMRFGTAGLG